MCCFDLLICNIKKDKITQLFFNDSGFSCSATINILNQHNKIT